MKMLEDSGYDWSDGCGFGVLLDGAADWSTARGLVARNLGWIEGGRPTSHLPGRFFANEVATQITHPDEVRPRPRLYWG
jgi:hypothetical protein